MVRIVIGTEASQYISQRVLQYSIEKHTPDAEIYIRTQTEKRLGGTKFGFVRFHTPSMFEFEGKAIYLDADQIVLKNLNNLVSLLDEQHHVALVCSPEGYFGQQPVPQRLETSVMVLNCHKLRYWCPNTIFNHIVPNDLPLKEKQIHYRDFMWLTWMDPHKIQCIDPGWNHFNILNSNTKLVHFSHVRSQPWKNPRHPLTNFWVKWLLEAIDAGYIKRRELFHAVLKRHIHPYFIKYMFQENTVLDEI
jgi:lipopolysaccharide biosynthesis glycosyltransferase